MNPNTCSTPNGCESPDCPRCREEWIYDSCLLAIGEEVRMLKVARAQLGLDESL